MQHKLLIDNNKACKCVSKILLSVKQTYCMHYFKHCIQNKVFKEVTSMYISLIQD